MKFFKNFPGNHTPGPPRAFLVSQSALNLLWRKKYALTKCGNYAPLPFKTSRYATATLSSYSQKWKLKLSRPITKTVTVVFHLHNEEATRQLKIAAESRILPFSAEPTYLGVKLNGSLKYRRHLESLRKKLTTRVGLLRRLAGTSWGAGARTLRITTLGLIHSAAEKAYCAPVWNRSAHTRLFDKPINDALRRVTGCLLPGPYLEKYFFGGLI